MTRANETKSYQSMVIFVQVMIMSSCFWNSVLLGLNAGKCTYGKTIGLAEC